MVTISFKSKKNMHSTGLCLPHCLPNHVYVRTGCSHSVCALWVLTQRMCALGAHTAYVQGIH